MAQNSKRLRCSAVDYLPDRNVFSLCWKRAKFLFCHYYARLRNRTRVIVIRSIRNIEPAILLNKVSPSSNHKRQTKRRQQLSGGVNLVSKVGERGRKKVRHGPTDPSWGIHVLPRTHEACWSYYFYSSSLKQNQSWIIT